MAGFLKVIKRVAAEIESPMYAVTYKTKDYEERVYPGAKWVSSTMNAMTRKQAMTILFRKLFKYISGDNIKNEKMPMTAPVTMFVEPGAGPNCTSRFTMSFYLSDEYQNKPPKPWDQTVFIEKRPDIAVITRTVPGYGDDRMMLEEALNLGSLIKEARDDRNVLFDSYFTVGYDSPYKLFNRKNEIWFVKLDP